jgi:hypothetical protein
VDFLLHGHILELNISVSFRAVSTWWMASDFNPPVGFFEKQHSFGLVEFLAGIESPFEITCLFIDIHQQPVAPVLLGPGIDFLGNG